MLAATLAAVLFQLPAQDLGKIVSFEARAERLELLMPKLSKATGLKFRHTPATEDEVLVVSVEGVKVGELMDRIAKVTLGTWKQQKDEWFLHADTKAFEREAANEKSQRIAGIRQEIEKLKAVALAKDFTLDEGKLFLARVQGFRKILQENPEDFATSAEFSNLSVASPAGRAFVKCLEAIGPDALAEVGEGEAVVYSSRPNKQQRPLEGAEPILSSLDTEQAIWSGLVADLRGRAEPTIHNDPIDFHGAPLDGPWLLVQLSKRDQRSGTKVNMIVMDGQGRARVTYDLDIQSTNLIQPKTATPGPAMKTFEPSPLGEKYSDLTGGGMRTFELAKGEWIEKLSRPDIYDPLSFVATDFLFEYAKQADLQLVACPPGMLMRLFERKQKLTLNKLRDQAEAIYELKLQEDGDWLLGRPISYHKDRLGREDRRAAAKLLQQAVADGYMGIEPYADYLREHPNLVQPYIIRKHVRGLLVQEGSLPFGHPPLFRAYAGLTLGQRTALMAGSEVPVSELAADVASDIKKTMLSPGRGVEFSTTGGQSLAFLHEATQLLPAEGGALRWKVSTEPVATRFVQLQGFRRCLTSSAKEWNEVNEESGVPEPEGWLGRGNTIKWEVVYPNGVIASDWIREYAVPTNVPTQPIKG